MIIVRPSSIYQPCIHYSGRLHLSYDYYEYWTVSNTPHLPQSWCALDFRLFHDAIKYLYRIFAHAFLTNHICLTSHSHGTPGISVSPTTPQRDSDASSPSSRGPPRSTACRDRAAARIIGSYIVIVSPSVLQPQLLFTFSLSRSFELLRT